MIRTAVVLLAVGAVAPAAAAAAGSERSWTSPKETDSVLMAEEQLQMGFSPRPTPAPQPRGLFGRMDLVPRLDGYTLGPATCGFVKSNGNSFTCVANTATCTDVNGYMGCCQPNQQCSRIQTVCIDYASSKAGKCDLLSDFHTVCCSATAPACYTYLMERTGGKNSGSVVTALACYTTSGTATLLDYDPSWSRTHSFASSTSSTSSQSSTTATSTTSQSSAATTTSGGDGGDGGSKTNVGAIAGGTVGGVAAIGLVGLAAFLLLRRKKQGKDSDVHSSPQQPMSQHTAQSPPQGYPPTSPAPQSSYQGYSPAPQGPYDPHMSVYSQQQPYSPQSGYPQQFPQQYQQQYPQQGAYPQQYGAAGFPVSSTGSPPPHTTPSPNITNDNREHSGVPSSPHAASPPPGGEHAHQQPQELGTVAPLGKEGNRAELS
ncbi:hypothetical protein JDV02_001282 [Purpureocillium takamizusanense]|uniref:Uncharacterized protein n=1 Tax=Purpureocillium takamizusanense TaxID=2060973 RepID=A0A9Q8Q6R9_9HYPO|nr:uncharacterized protein JDV02_001282 [Purpureocillium takamizusanense]UNI14678.1 hypothetical protein JDV02_001282 [Purpureocillium takamizusanense]